MLGARTASLALDMIAGSERNVVCKKGMKRKNVCTFVIFFAETGTFYCLLKSGNVSRMQLSMQLILYYACMRICNIYSHVHVHVYIRVRIHANFGEHNQLQK